MEYVQPKVKLVAVALIASLALACDEFSNPTGPEPPGAGPGTGSVLSVPFAPQQTEVWCWAAVSEMVLRYYGAPVAQCQILSAWYNGNCCTFPGFCLTTASIDVIRTTLSSFGGVGSLYLPRPLTFGELSAEIEAGRPVIAAYRGSFSGHVVVMYGYEPGGFVYIHDPFFGTYARIPYGSSFTYGGQLVWAETLYGLG